MRRWGSERLRCGRSGMALKIQQTSYRIPLADRAYTYVAQMKMVSQKLPPGVGPLARADWPGQTEGADGLAVLPASRAGVSSLVARAVEALRQCRFVDHLSKGGFPMATYILLSNLTDEGPARQDERGRIKEVNKECQALGVTVKAQYAVLGPYDFVNIVEDPPDNETMARVSAEPASLRGARKS